MAKRKKKQQKLPVELLVLLLGLVLVVSIIGFQTNWFNFASGPSDRALENLNSTTELLETKNIDGTMGPKDAYGNWSNSVPEFLKGKLVFGIIDPPSGNKPDNPGSQGRRPTESYHTPQGKGQDDGDNDGSPSAKKGDHGPQAVTALNVTITKVEVHLANLGKPGDQKDVAGKLKDDKTASVPAKPGNAVSHWETLNVNAPVTLDLVELAKTKDVSLLGITSLAEGRYTEVRLYVSTASATLEGGLTVPLEIPGKNNIVRVVRPFMVSAGMTTTLTMDIDAQRSVIKTGKAYILKPVVARLIEEKNNN